MRSSHSFRRSDGQGDHCLVLRLNVSSIALGSRTETPSESGGTTSLDHYSDRSLRLLARSLSDHSNLSSLQVRARNRELGEDVSSLSLQETASSLQSEISSPSLE